MFDGKIGAFCGPSTADEQNPEEDRKLRPLLPDTDGVAGFVCS
jgi:hypothetical protein